MADVSGGNGWWQASDGKWYPPEAHPGYGPTQPAPQASSGIAPSSPQGPAPEPQPHADTLKDRWISRWRRHPVWWSLLAAFVVFSVIGGISNAVNPPKKPRADTTTTSASPTTTTAPVTTTSHPKQTTSTTHPPTTTTAPPPPPTTTPPPPTTTTAPPPPPPTTTTTPPPAPAAPAAPAGCYPLSSGGNCYSAGQLCRNSDHGMHGVAANGEAIVCEDNNGWRWEPA
jgi:hypothetical protein